MHTLTVKEVLAWFDEAKDIELLRGERARPWEQLRQGVLPDAGTAGNGYVPYRRYLESLLKPVLDRAREPFAGTPVPAGSAPLDPDVRVRVTPTVVKGRAKADPAQRDALKAEIRLMADTLDAAAQLLMNHYCLLGTDVAPAFGDYLSVPNQHAGRYVLRDPATGRDVSFSVQSGGTVPYRFAWLDEDFSGTPFARQADPSVPRTRVDVWRRCR